MNPWRNFKQQPWSILFWVAVMTLILVAIADQILLTLLQRSEAIYQAFTPLLNSPLGEVFPFFVGMGIGSLSVVLAERERSRLFLNASSLWALILCLFLGLILKYLILPAGFVQLSGISLTGVMIGVFWKGRPYWR